MSERVLTNEVIALRKKRAVEREKAKQEARSETTDVAGSETPSTPNIPSTPKASQEPKSALEQNYYNLIQLVVRYGERPIVVEDTKYTIGEVIIYTLEDDDIQAPKPVYQILIDEFKKHYQDPGFKAESFFKFHSNPEVSALAVDMIAEKYQFATPDNEERMGELVTQLLYEIKLTVINQQIEELERNLKEAQRTGNWEYQVALLKHQPELLAQRNEICKLLGNRIINV